MRNGYGEYKFRAGTADTVRTGYWETDKYIGIHEKPYKVTLTTTNVKTVRFLKLDDVGDQVELVFKQGGKEDNNVLSLILDGSSGNQEITMPSPSKFMNVMFPFNGEMSYTTIPQTSAYGGTGGTRIYCQVKFEIYEKGIWRVTVTM